MSNKLFSVLCVSVTPKDFFAFGICISRYSRYLCHMAAVRSPIFCFNVQNVNFHICISATYTNKSACAFETGANTSSCSMLELFCSSTTSLCILTAEIGMLDYASHTCFHNLQEDYINKKQCCPIQMR